MYSSQQGKRVPRNQKHQEQDEQRRSHLQNVTAVSCKCQRLFQEPFDFGLWATLGRMEDFFSHDLGNGKAQRLLLQSCKLFLGPDDKGTIIAIKQIETTAADSRRPATGAFRAPVCLSLPRSVRKSVPRNWRCPESVPGVSSTPNMTGRRFHRTMAMIPALPW